jgi:HD superfamily phosphohydrolase
LIEKGAITGPEVERVVKLIHGVSDGVRAWEFELISNKWTGIDVDKLDYFRRDAFYLGAKGVLIDHDLLMNEARILVDEKNSSAKYIIGYPSKYALQVNDIFYSRYKLYKTFYLNSISKGVEFMIMDVLKLIEPIF